MTTIIKKDLRKIHSAKLAEWLVEVKQPAFRQKQIEHWLWEKSVNEISAMRNLPKTLVELLERDFEIRPMVIELEQKSSDGTVKCRFELFDGHKVEGVLIPTDDRSTACVSSQIGCSLSCSFCATGLLKRVRNLDPAEIYDQVVLLNQMSLNHYERNLSNIVFMGMGEPLLNYKNVLEAIDKITSDTGLGMAAKRITVSTAGIAKMIHKLVEDKVRFNLALSLHAANDEKRNRIMGINESNNLDTLLEALANFKENCRGQITYEYVLLNGFNDSLEDAKELVGICRKVWAKVNIIEYNSVDGLDYKKSSSDKLNAFVAVLVKNKVNVNVRCSRGKDIDAACGQLANK